MANIETQTYPIEHLRDFSTGVFLKCGMTEEDAGLGADVLAASDLRGIDSHGIARLWAYVRVLKAGGANPRPDISLVRETASTATIDGDGGLGIIVGPKANQIAIEKALDVGTGWVAVRGSNHFGIAGYYPSVALEHDMIGWAMTNCSPHVAPLWGIDPRLGTNPISIAFPAGNESPVVIDMSTSVVAGGKLEIARRAGEEVPDGWVIDAEGHATNDPNALSSKGTLLPLGGDHVHGGHKGYCLAAVVDLLSGVLSGADWGPFVSAFAMTELGESRRDGSGWGHFFGAMRVDAFCEIVEFKTRVDEWILSMRSSRAAPGTTGPIIPGDPEREAEQHRTKNGVPLSVAVVETLRDVSRQTGVPFHQ